LTRSRLRLIFGVPLLAAAAAAGAWFWQGRGAPPLPADLKGTLVFVSGRAGLDSLFVKRLPDGEERRLTLESEPVAEPALSADGARAAFVVGGRIGLATLANGDVRLLTLGVDWKDATPAWLPDGRGLVVCSRRAPGERADLHVLAFAAPPPDGQVERRPLLTTPAFDETQPVVSGDGKALTFLRGEHLFRLTLADGRVKRLTGGFRQYRALRRLPSERLLALWSQDKQFGIDLIDADGGKRETLSQGSVFYRNVAPSPDGRYLAATFTFDLGFHPLDALRGRSEELRLLDASGRELGVLARSWRRGNHSPAWGP
jgi:Tol biopolymer transport system component